MPLIPRVISAFCALLFFLTVSIAANAIERIAPPGSRIAIVPPPGFTVSKAFQGFENRKAGASIVVAEFPAGAFAQMRSGMTAEVMAKRGTRFLSRASIDGFPFDHFLLNAERSAPHGLIDQRILVFDANIFVGMVTVNTWRNAPEPVDDTRVLNILANIHINTKEAVNPRAGLPFEIATPPRFQHQQVLGQLVLLKDSPPPPKGKPNDATMVISVGNQLIREEDRIGFGKLILSKLRAAKVENIVSLKPTTVGNLHGHEYHAQGRYSSGDAVRFVMVMLYGEGRHYMLLGFAPTKMFEDAVADFQNVITSFHLKS